ncbi:hypothetical protein ACIPYR_12110 [Streptomyces parvus]|uniref:hypothetical protein n=1 Tax=Streptomyces parvus TaxID=66428 RepID=UPI00381FC410
MASLIVREGRVTARLCEGGVLWHDSGSVTRIPYETIATVTVTPHNETWSRLRISLRQNVGEHRGPYELNCLARHCRPFATALDRLAREARTAHRGHRSRRPADVTTEPIRSLPLRERHSPVRLAFFALLTANLLASLVLLALGHPARAVGVWFSVAPWSVVALIAPVLRFGFVGARDPWTRGIRVEARYVDRGTTFGSGGPWPMFVYEFTDPDGVVRKHELRPSGRFARPRPVRVLWFVPGERTSHTLGDPFTALFITVVTGGMLLFLGGIGLALMPGLLIGVLG